MAKKKEAVRQPGDAEQRLLDSIMNNTLDEVVVRGKKWKVGWQRNGVLRRVTNILLKANPSEGGKPKEEDYEGNAERYQKDLAKYEREAIKYAEDEDKIICKCVAALRCDKFLKSKFYWLVWRWYYYVKRYSAEELLPYINECKKKVPVESYYTSIILLTGMKDTMMAMTREEVNRFQVEQLMAQRGASAKTTRV